MNDSADSIPPPPRIPARLPFTWWALAVIVLIYLCRLAPTARTFSQTIDEPYYIGSAVAMYDARAHILGVQHPPLTRLVIGLPLRLAGADLPEYRGQTGARKEDPAYAAGAKLLFAPPDAPDEAHYWRLLTTARYASLLFPTLALLYAFLLARHFAGDLAGLAAALLLSLDATFLGHGLWCTTDAAATAGLLAALYHALRYTENPTARNTAIAAIALGLAITCKFSVAIVVPALLVLFAIRLPFRQLRWQIPLAVGICFLTIWAVYLFHIGPLGASDTLAAAPQWSRLPGWIKNTPIPMPAFFLGLARLAAHSATGHDTYFLGQLLDHASRLYFPVLFLAKTPPALLAVLITGYAFLRKRDSAILLPCLLPASIFLAAALFGGIQIGIRHILPAIALLYIPAAITLTQTRPRLLVLALLSLTATGETAFQHPDYLAYYNYGAGGPRNGPHIALDSNTDWGQDLAGLARATKARTIPPLAAIYPFGDRQAPLLKTLGLDPNLLNNPTPQPGSYIAISRSRLGLEPGQFPNLKNLPETASIGAGIVIYQLPPDPASSPLPVGSSATQPSPAPSPRSTR